MKKKDVIRFLIFRTIGNFFILFTIFGFFATFGPALYHEINYRAGTFAGVRFRLAEEVQSESPLGKILVEEKSRNSNLGSPPSTPSNQTQPSPVPDGIGLSFLGAILSGQKEQILTPKSTEFSIVIPKIGANERVLANTDPSNEKEYLEVLKQGVAHAKGSSFPGRGENIYLFAHSADNFWNVGRYNAVFYLIKELEVGDEVVVFFQNKRHNYIVFDKKVADAEEVEFISSNINQGEVLTLQTCWPPGTTWKRILIFARPKSM